MQDDQAQHVEPPKAEPAADGSLHWFFTPHRHAAGDLGEIYGRLDVHAEVHAREHHSICTDVFFAFKAGALTAKASLTPDEADAIADGLKAAATQARENAAHHDFLDDVSDRLRDPNYDAELETFCDPRVHYCHPDDFVETCKRFPRSGHIVIARASEPRAA